MTRGYRRMILMSESTFLPDSADAAHALHDYLNAHGQAATITRAPDGTLQVVADLLSGWWR